MKLKQHFYFLILLFILSILSHHVWFSNLAPITYGDWIYDFQERMAETFDLPRIWHMSYSLGAVNLGASFWPIYSFHGLLAKFNFGYEVGERIMFLWPIPILTSLSMYLLAYYIFRSKIGAFIAAIVYSFNAFFLTLDTGPLTLRMAMGPAPLLLLFFIKALEARKIYYAILAGVIAFISSFYEFRIFYLYLLLLGFYALYHFFLLQKKWDTKNIFGVLSLTAVVILIPFLMNVYWFIALKNIGLLTNNVIFSRDLFGTSFVDIIKAITLFPYLWTGSSIRAFEVQPIPFRFFLIPIFAFSGLLVCRKNKHVLFFTLLGLLGVLLVKQTAEPFPDLYRWLFNNFPGFKAFRESTKFYFFIALSYSVLIGAFIAWIWQWAKDRWQKVVASFVTIFIGCLFLWNAKPLATGEIRTLFVTRSVPNDYKIVKDFILKQPDYFRTFWVPHFSRWSIYTNLHPKVSAINLIQYDWVDLDTYKPENINFQLNMQITHYLKQPFSANLFKIASVKYFFIPLEDRDNDDNFIIFFGTRKFFMEELDRLDYLKKIDIGTQNIVIYENVSYRPHIYLTEAKETIQSDIPFIPVDFQYKNQTEYKVNLENISKSVYLNFSEAYHKDWRVKAGDFNWWSALFDNKYFLPNDQHYQNDAKLNSFIIDPQSIKKSMNNNQYTSNPDGSINMKITLFFQPQSYVNLGFIISSLTLIICVVFLVILGYNSLHKNHQ